MDWIEIVNKIGIPTAVVFAIGYFFYVKIWPIIETKIKEGEIERQKYLTSLDTLASSRDIERKQAEIALDKAQETRFSERQQFMKLIADQTDMSKSNNTAVIVAISNLTNQINNLQNQAAENQRETLKVLNELITTRAKRS